MVGNPPNDKKIITEIHAGNTACTNYEPSLKYEKAMEQVAATYADLQAVTEKIYVADYILSALLRYVVWQCITELLYISK
jgi:hypothetical protein